MAKCALELSDLNGDGLTDGRIESDSPPIIPAPGDKIRIPGDNVAWFVVNRQFTYHEDGEQHVQVFCETAEKHVRRMQEMKSPLRN